ncbi:MAG: hypothetical protein PVH95_13130 [Anaerolineae bacterium]|jgi:hypothetical protein
MTEIAVYDLLGRTRPIEWAFDKYGPFVIYPAAQGDSPLAWKLTALREKNDAAFVASAIGEGGPQPAVRVAFYWPDAPVRDDAGPLGAPFEGITPKRAACGYTDVTGHVGFGMGPGATYNAELGERGPHAAWIAGARTRSDVILGMGMIPDDHLHLNAEWTLVDDDEPNDDDLAALLRQLAGSLRTIATLVEEIAND